MAVYSMVAYDRVFFSHTYRVDYEMNYFCFNLAKLILLILKKITQSNLILPKQFWQKRARLNSNTEKNRNRYVVDQVQHSQKPTYFLPVHTWQVR